MLCAPFEAWTYFFPLKICLRLQAKGCVAQETDLIGSEEPEDGKLTWHLWFWSIVNPKMPVNVVTILGT